MKLRPENIAFGKRLNIACDQNPSVPPLYKGRLTWIRDKLLEEGDEFALESVRRWFIGTVRPRYPTLMKLAKILNCDLPWLATGSTSALTTSERRKAVLSFSGSVSLVGGLIQSVGFSVSYPEDSETANLYAMISGRKYEIYTSAVSGVDGNLSVNFPTVAIGKSVLMAVDVDPEELTVAVYEISDALILSKGVPVEDETNLTLDPSELERIPTLGQFVQNHR